MTDVISPAARSLILGRVRDVLGERPPAAGEYAGISRTYARGGALPEPARIDLFVDRLEHYQVGVVRCGRHALPDTIAAILARREKGRLLVPPDIPRDWLASGASFVEDRDLTYAELDRSDGVLTACSVAIAATGTIVLRHSQGEGRRALTLVPDYHLCIVGGDQIVETVPEAFERLAGWQPALVTTISGPSATADIEMTRVRGVHGPRTLDVIVMVG